MRLAAAALGCAAAAAARPLRFDGHSILRASPRGAAEFDAVLRLCRAHTDQSGGGVDCDVWAGSGDQYVPGATVSVRVGQEGAAALQRSGVPVEVEVADLQQAFDAMGTENRTRWHPGQRLLPDFFTEWRDFEEIRAAVEQVRARHQDIATALHFGVSREGRELFGLKLATSQYTPKPAVWVNCGQHAREWMGHMFCTYLLATITEQYAAGDARVRSLLGAADLHVMSIVNPDGFVYTWEADRTWRKTRAVNHDGTRGVDPNRNWDWNWGCSSSPSSSSYCGPAPHSEPETRQTAGYILAEKSIVAGFDMHTSGRWILRAWTFSQADSPVEAYSDEVGELYREAVLATHGRNYRNVKGINGLGPAQGCLEDWFAGGPADLPIPSGRPGGGDPYAAAANASAAAPPGPGRRRVTALLPYTIEISTSQTPAPSTILADVEENYAGILASMRYVADHYEVIDGHAYRK